VRSREPVRAFGVIFCVSNGKFVFRSDGRHHRPCKLCTKRLRLRLNFLCGAAFRSPQPSRVRLLHQGRPHCANSAQATPSGFTPCTKRHIRSCVARCYPGNCWLLKKQMSPMRLFF
jgi:hypothetical protein